MSATHGPKKPRQVRAVSTNGSKPNAKDSNGVKRRLRRPALLPEPGCGQVPYAKKHPDLKDITDAKAARLVLDSDAWPG